jgi:hypothetical protein
MDPFTTAIGLSFLGRFLKDHLEEILIVHPAGGAARPQTSWDAHESLEILERKQWMRRIAGTSSAPDSSQNLRDGLERPAGNSSVKN